MNFVIDGTECLIFNLIGGLNVSSALFIDSGNNYEIYTKHDYRAKCDTCFEVDESIALAIQLLNRRGYRTYGCCSGHILQSCQYMNTDFESMGVTEYSAISNRGFIVFAEEYAFKDLLIHMHSCIFRNGDLQRDTTCIEWVYLDGEGTFKLQLDIAKAMQELYDWASKLEVIAESARKLLIVNSDWRFE